MERKTKPQLAIGQIGRLLAAGLPARWAAYDEVYGRSSELRRFCESGNLAHVAVVPRDFRVTLPSGAVIRADEVARDAVFEQRSCGNGSKGPHRRVLVDARDRAWAGCDTGPGTWRSPGSPHPGRRGPVASATVTCAFTATARI